MGRKTGKETMMTQYNRCIIKGWQWMAQAQPERAPLEELGGLLRGVDTCTFPREGYRKEILQRE